GGALLGDGRALDGVDADEVTRGPAAALTEDFLPNDHDDVEAVGGAVGPTDDLAVVLNRSGTASLSDPLGVESVEIDVDLDRLKALHTGDVPLDAAIGTTAGELFAIVHVVAGLKACGAVIEVSSARTVDRVE